MIRINLLPDQYRKKARTPIKLLLGVTVAAGLNTGLAAWWGHLALGVQSEIDGERSSVQLEMDGLTPQVNYFRSLQSEAKQYNSRETALSGITKSRVSWTRKLDELIDVINRGGDGQRHLVWLDDLAATQNNDAKNFGSLSGSGHSGSDKFAQVANFLEDLEASPFMSDFQPPAPPEGTQTLQDETLVPPVVWAFPLSLNLKSPDERSKVSGVAEEKGAKGAASATTNSAPAKTQEKRQ